MSFPCGVCVEDGSSIDIDRETFQYLYHGAVFSWLSFYVMFGIQLDLFIWCRVELTINKGGDAILFMIYVVTMKILYKLTCWKMSTRVPTTMSKATIPNTTLELRGNIHLIFVQVCISYTPVQNLNVFIFKKHQWTP